MNDDLIASLRALAAAQHADLSLAADAVIEIERLTSERDEALAEVERLHKAHQAACEGGDLLRAENARLRAQVAEYFAEPATHPVERAE